MTAEAGRPVIDIRPSPTLPARLVGLGSIFGKSIHDGGIVGLLLGGIGGLFMLGGGAAMAAEWPDQLSRVRLVASLELLPPIVRGLLGDPIKLDTLGGFLSWRFLGVVPVMLGIWSIIAMSGTLAGEARRGSLDLVVTTPVSRRSIAAQKALAHVVLVLVAVLIAAVLTWLTGIVFGTLPVDAIPLANALGAWLLVGLLMLAAGAVAFAAAPIVGRTRAAGIAAGFLFGGYLVSSYRSIVPSLEALEPVSWFAWTSGHRPLAGLWDWPPVLLVAVVTAVLFGLGVVAFERRDVGATAGTGRLRLPGLPAGIRGPFTRQLADRTADALGWGIGIGFYGVFVASSADEFVLIFDQMPGMLEMMSRVYPGIDLHEPSALLELAFVAFGSLLIGLAAAGLVAGMTSDETGHRLDLVLSTPASRIHWFLATGLASLAAVTISVFVAGLMIAVVVAGEGGSATDPFLGSAVLALYGGAFVGIGLAIAGLGWPRQAGIAAGAISIASYLLGSLGTALRLPEWLVDLSLSEHLGRPMTGGFDPVGIALMAVLAVGGLVVGAWGFARRDLLG